MKKNTLEEKYPSIVKSSGKFNLSQSYISLILGILVVLFVVGFIGLFFKNRDISKIEPVDSKTLSKEIENVKQKDTYTVSEGDTLWSIAEKKYNSGFVWTEIAKENNISNPDLIEVGTVLVFKKTSEVVKNVVVEKKATPAAISDDLKQAQLKQTDSITSSTYTIREGDYLWEIAIRAYGDGYKWVDIVKANNYPNPDLIFVGNKLTIPR